MIYIGIDPGLSGAVAAISDAGAEVFDTPVFTVDSKRKFDAVNMAKMLANLTDNGFDQSFTVLELVHSMPKQGVASSFSFGEGLGIWKGILAAYGLPYENVSPQRWKKSMMADQGKAKDAARYKAQQLFPQIADYFSRVKDDGRAEALLMAEFGKRLKGGSESK